MKLVDKPKNKTGQYSTSEDTLQNFEQTPDCRQYFGI